MMSEHLEAKIGQYALIKNSENKILILERSRSKKWCLPGGRLNKDEDWKEAFSREIKEEIGAEVTNPKPFDIKIITDPYQIKYCVYFTVEADHLSQLKISDEHSGLKWINTEGLVGLTFGDPEDKDVLVKFFQSQ